ncbi:rhodanese-like domain-containing protein [Actinomadura viridis]|uniref:Rhodanese-related sulfurtransferase n=1 Tax=Actinomadura viridis TaxID=58110 RepID=A0A931DNE3_9ACTN|nr:rhodanese-like domain-containing protein [Actinomadura viridis]MBG6091839.1 rhodanese-related sulfurtransferase [Actinomadura viridis]
MSTTPTMDAFTLRQRLASPHAPRLLDVRTPAEYAAVHIPGSANVPLDDLPEHGAELRRRLRDDDVVVLICRTGGRAARAERVLAEAGLSGLHVLDGGILAWQEAGSPVDRGRRRWDLERQVRLVAGSLVLAGVLGGLAVPALTWLAAAIGAGLVVAALTNTCAMGLLLSKLPFNRAASCDVETAVRRLARDGASR